LIFFRLTFQILCKLGNQPRLALAGGLPLSAVPSSLIQGGNPLFRIGACSRSIGAGNGFGRSGACSISMAAARSSARSSTSLLIISINAFRKLAMRFMRLRRTSASWPLFSDIAYSTNLRSLSSAVLGRDMGRVPLLRVGADQNGTVGVYQIG